MKNSLICGLLAVCGMFFVLCGNVTMVKGAEKSSPYEVAISGVNEMQEISRIPCAIQNGEIKAPKTNCRYYYYYRYYRPVVYYRPVYYYSYTTTYYYSYRYVVFYNAMNDQNSNGSKGFLLEKTPDAETPLAKLGIKKGDIITKINGKPLNSVADIDNINEKSDLTVLKSSVSSVRSSEEKPSTSGSNPLFRLFHDI